MLPCTKWNAKHVCLIQPKRTYICSNVVFYKSELFHSLSGTDRDFLEEVEKALREAHEASQTLKAHW